MPDRKTALPLQTRLAPVSSVNTDARTADMVWTTGAQVRRYDWMNDRVYMEELSLDPNHVRMGRFASGGAPLLDTHSRWSLSDVLGVVEKASIDGKEGRATVRFSKRDDVTPIFDDVRDGILKNVSVGYAIYRMERIPPQRDGEPWTYRAVDWEPMEVSLVPVGADPNAGMRSDGSPSERGQAQVRTFECVFDDAATPATSVRNDDMTDPVNKPNAAGDTQPRNDDGAASRAAEAARAEGQRVERERQAGIRTAVRAAKLGDEFAQKLIDDGTALDAARVQVLDELAKRSEESERASPTRPHTNVQTLVDETETRREAIAGAILHRMNGRGQLPEASREWRYMSLMRLAEETLARENVKVRGMPQAEIASRALMSTSDFPNILANVLNKRLRQSYDENMPSYQRWARRAPNAPDFKAMTIVQLGAAPDLLQVNENGEFKTGSMSDGIMTYSVITYGRIVPVSRQVLINDDLRAMDRLVGAFGASARRLENRTVYGILTTNAALADGTALFHANHSNYTSGGGSALSLTSLNAGRVAMRKQKGLQSEELNIAPAFLLVPADLEQTAYQLTSANFVPTKPADTNEFRAGGRTAVEPIVEAVLSATSATGWYLAADSAQIDTVEYAFLDGSEGAYIENRIGFEVDGMEVKARLDFGAKAIDYRGLYNSAGA